MEKGENVSKTIIFLKSEELLYSEITTLNQIGFLPITLPMLLFDYEGFESTIIDWLNQIDHFDALAFNSINSVRSVGKVIRSEQKNDLAKKRIYCVGQKTANAIKEEFNCSSTLIAETQKLLAEKLKENIETETKILYFLGNLSDLSSDFNDCKYLRIQSCISYKTCNISKDNFQIMTEEKIQEVPFAIVYYSPSNVSFFMNNLSLIKLKGEISFELQKVKCHIAFGLKTYSELNKYSFPSQELTISVCEKPTFENIISILELMSK